MVGIYYLKWIWRLVLKPQYLIETRSFTIKVVSIFMVSEEIKEEGLHYNKNGFRETFGTLTR